MLNALERSIWRGRHVDCGFAVDGDCRVGSGRGALTIPALSSPVSFRLSDGSTVTIDPDGKETRAYANGDVVTRFPDGVVKKTTAAGVSTAWHPDGSVESSQGDHTQTWDASTGGHVDRTSAANHDPRGQQHGGRGAGGPYDGDPAQRHRDPRREVRRHP